MVKPVVIPGLHNTFIISSDPNLFGWDRYLQMLTEHSVHLIIEFSTAIYPPEVTNHFLDHQIRVNYLPVQEGHFPTPKVIQDWFTIIDQSRQIQSAIALHCNSGFGRAPLMVAVSLIRDGQTAYSAIELIRKYRPHALNQLQVGFLYDFEIEIHKHSCSVQ